MLLLAKKIGGDWEGLGQALGLPGEELTEIKEGPDSSTYQGAFKVRHWARLLELFMLVRVAYAC